MLIFFCPWLHLCGELCHHSRKKRNTFSITNPRAQARFICSPEYLSNCGSLYLRLDQLAQLLALPPGILVFQWSWVWIPTLPQNFTSKNFVNCFVKFLYGDYIMVYPKETNNLPELGHKWGFTRCNFYWIRWTEKLVTNVTFGCLNNNNKILHFNRLVVINACTACGAD